MRCSKPATSWAATKQSTGSSSHTFAVEPAPFAFISGPKRATNSAQGALGAERLMARDFDPYMLSSPRIFMVRMIIFMIIAAFVPLVLYREVAKAFMANPGLNGLIVGVLVIGIAMSVRNVI